MVHFVGAGPGAPDLITQRGAAFFTGRRLHYLRRQSGQPGTAGAWQSRAVPSITAPKLTLEQVLDVMRRMEAAGKSTVRLHTGDPCLYGAIREQMDAAGRRRHLLR